MEGTIALENPDAYDRNNIKLMEFRLQRGIRTPEQIIADIPKGDAEYPIRHNGSFKPKEVVPEAKPSTLYPPKPSINF